MVREKRGRERGSREWSVFAVLSHTNTDIIHLHYYTHITLTYSQTSNIPTIHTNITYITYIDSTLTFYKYHTHHTQHRSHNNMQHLSTHPHHTTVTQMPDNGQHTTSLTLGMSAAGVTVKLEPMAKHRSASCACSKLFSNVSAVIKAIKLHHQTCTSCIPGYDPVHTKELTHTCMHLLCTRLCFCTHCN